MLSVESSTSISVSWEPVDCRHRNGEIRGYSVRNWKVGVSEEDRIVSGSNIRLQGLTKQTVYTQKCLYIKSIYPGVYGPIQSISQVGEAKVKHLNMGRLGEIFSLLFPHCYALMFHCDVV